jgi:hypothetical protein
MAALEWSKKQSGSTVSAAAGPYRIHRSGVDLVTAYKLEPFLPLGMHPGAKAAMQACQDHHDQENHNAD